MWQVAATSCAALQQLRSRRLFDHVEQGACLCEHNDGWPHHLHAQHPAAAPAAAPAPPLLDFWGLLLVSRQLGCVMRWHQPQPHHVPTGGVHAQRAIGGGLAMLVSGPGIMPRHHGAHTGPSLWRLAAFSADMALQGGKMASLRWKGTHLDNMRSVRLILCTF